jgi:uncharacterized protein with GYD domain
VLADVGGTVASFDFAFGANDVVLIVEVPDRVAVAAVAMMVGAGGGATCKTTVLLSPEEIDQAAEIKATYRAPGS